MKGSIVILSVFMLMSGLARAVNPTSLEQAKGMANRQGKPILLEFFQPDCEFCQIAARDFASNDTILEILKSVIYLPLDVNSPEGERLSSVYYVQNDYPVFSVIDSAGEIIDHWTGYSTPPFFLQPLSKALSTQITIKSRYERLENSPTIDDALFLAKYNSEIGDNVKSAELYRQAQNIQNNPAYLYNIFQNTADAVWKGNLPFENLIPAADDVLIAKARDVAAVAGVARIISNVARRIGKTSEIGKYLNAGIAITKGREDIRSKEWYTLFTADYALYVDRDTSKAISIEKLGLGPNWENKPGKFYSYAKWCLERKINLDEAEKYAAQAVDRASEGKFKASILVTLANIYEARGKITDAANAMDLAVKQDPNNPWYASEAKRLHALTNSKK